MNESHGVCVQVGRSGSVVPRVAERRCVSELSYRVSADITARLLPGGIRTRPVCRAVPWRWAGRRRSCGLTRRVAPFGVRPASRCLVCAVICRVAVTRSPGVVDGTGPRPRRRRAAPSCSPSGLWPWCVLGAARVSRSPAAVRHRWRRSRPGRPAPKVVCRTTASASSRPAALRDRSLARSSAPVCPPHGTGPAPGCGSLHRRRRIRFAVAAIRRIALANKPESVV